MRKKFNQATIAKIFTAALLIFTLLVSCNTFDLSGIKIPNFDLSGIKIPDGTTINISKVPDGLMIATNIPLRNLLFPKIYLPSENKSFIMLNNGTVASLGLNDPYKDPLIQLLLALEQKLNIQAVPLSQDILNPFKLATSPSLPTTWDIRGTNKLQPVWTQGYRPICVFMSLSCILDYANNLTGTDTVSPDFWSYLYQEFVNNYSYLNDSPNQINENSSVVFACMIAAINQDESQIISIKQSYPKYKVNQGIIQTKEIINNNNSIGGTTFEENYKSNMLYGPNLQTSVYNRADRLFNTYSKQLENNTQDPVKKANFRLVDNRDLNTLKYLLYSDMPIVIGLPVRNDVWNPVIDQTQLPLVNALPKDLMPGMIEIPTFENEVLTKISDATDKQIIISSYNKTTNFYELRDSADRQRVQSILMNLGYRITDGNHAIVLVGYVNGDGTDAWAKKGYPSGYFIIRNSWGTAWGNYGYAKIPYGYVLEAGYQALVAYSPNSNPAVNCFTHIFGIACP